MSTTARARQLAFEAAQRRVLETLTPAGEAPSSTRRLTVTIVAAVLFLVIQALNKLKKQEEAKPKPPEVPADVKLLTEIRDLLATRK